MQKTTQRTCVNTANYVYVNLLSFSLAYLSNKYVRFFILFLYFYGFISSYIHLIRVVRGEYVDSLSLDPPRSESHRFHDFLTTECFINRGGIYNPTVVLPTT
jgi:hypothetical protein